MNILIVCKLLDEFTIYDSCLRLHVVLCALHDFGRNQENMHFNVNYKMVEQRLCS